MKEDSLGGDEEEATEQVNPEIARKYMQKATFNAFERVLCTHILESINADPLLTLSHITRAALSVEKAQAAALGVNQDQARQLYTLAQRLTTATKKEVDGETMYMINLESVEWEKGLLPWVRMKSYETNLTPQEEEEWLKTGKNKDPRSLIIYSAKHLSDVGYAHMVSDFLDYSIPHIEDMTRVLSGLVNESTYVDMLKMYRGERAGRQ